MQPAQDARARSETGGEGEDRAVDDAARLPGVLQPAHPPPEAVPGQQQQQQQEERQRGRRQGLRPQVEDRGGHAVAHPGRVAEPHELFHGQQIGFRDGGGVRRTTRLCLGFITVILK